MIYAYNEEIYPRNDYFSYTMHVNLALQYT